jgi:predicted ArsR family transcriptional regulator
VTDETFARRVTKLGALADPVRRALYRFVSDQPDAVSRDQAANGVEVPRHTAKFHLDRLVDEGLLVAEFRRLTGRTGPGAGRPAKLYRRSVKEVTVSVPNRRYDLAGQVLADAVERSLGGLPMTQALTEAARNAARIVVDATSSPPTTGELERVAAVLREFGYEPRVDEDLVLTNCPFDRLVSDHRDLICGMNVDFVASVCTLLGCSGVRARREPDADGCCVRVSDVRQENRGPEPG